MKTFTAEELRIMDGWVAEHVMGYKLLSSDSNNSPLVAAFIDAHAHFDNWKTESGYISLPRYTTDPAASDALETEILKELGRRNLGLTIWDYDGYFRMQAGDLYARHPDKKVCRVLFSQLIFKDQP